IGLSHASGWILGRTRRVRQHFRRTGIGALHGSSLTVNPPAEVPLGTFENRTLQAECEETGSDAVHFHRRRKGGDEGKTRWKDDSHYGSGDAWDLVQVLLLPAGEANARPFRIESGQPSQFEAQRDRAGSAPLEPQFGRLEPIQKSRRGEVFE